MAQGAPPAPQEHDDNQGGDDGGGDGDDDDAVADPKAAVADFLHEHFEAFNTRKGKLKLKLTKVGG
jgi:hypothetical protein